MKNWTLRQECKRQGCGHAKESHYQSEFACTAAFCACDEYEDEKKQSKPPVQNGAAS